MRLTSPAFDDGSEIPDRFGYRKQNISPPLRIDGVPEGTQSLALVVDDPDAKEPAGKIWDHWVVWNIPPSISAFEEGWVPPEAEEGTNDYGELGYGGPNPPDRRHTYKFRLYALDTEMELEQGATKDELKDAMEGHVIEKTLLEGTYAP
ncbi:MAG: YbhB/YbcL family Raf kinase inhibitor-like protein [Candidatus Nanohaloarchaea archaeon]|nr:YbhB/YbcL family Raf kinase inhibitor-like protein [Candidatus Nanohaloarchaea archaeon]